MTRIKFGFTLIEILVVVAIVTIILALGVPIGVDTFKTYTRRSERDIVVSIFERARNMAINNIDESPHGVCFDDVGRNYVLFSGSAYDPNDSRNEPIPASSGVSLDNFPICRAGQAIVFAQLSGDLSPPRTLPEGELSIRITQDTRVSTISVNNAGRIEW